MGNCAAVNSQESVVYLMQKGETAKVIKLFTEFQDTFKSGYSLNSFGDTALHYSAALGNLDLVKWLCTHGASINALNSHNWTPSDSAYFNKHTSTLNYLQSTGGTLQYFKE